MLTYPLRTTILDPLAQLPGGDTLESILPRLSESRSPLFVLRDACSRVLTDMELRHAAQDHTERCRPVEGLARDDLAVASEAEAEARLEADPRLPAVLLTRGAEQACHFVERSVPTVTTAVVMAGGQGKRLRPLTADTPKPLVEVGGRPLLFRTLDLLEAHGVRTAHISIRHLGDRIRDALRGAREWSMDLHLLEEDEPLGTGAGLALLRDVDGPFFIANGDVLTSANLSALGRHHQLSGGLATVATTLFAAPLPYGLVHRRDGRIGRIEEKPVFRYPVNAGLYCFSREAPELVPAAKPLSLVDFLDRQIDAGRAVEEFPVVGYWNDVGRPEDHARAEADLAQRRVPGCR